MRSAEPPPARDSPTRVLFVCVGNICRSPLAEGVFRSLAQRTAPQFAVEVDSAGTHGYHLGRPPDARAQMVARGHGIDISGLRARLLVPEDFERFDWILVVDGQTYTAAQALAAPAARRGQLRLLMDYAPQQRLREIPDPYYGVASDFERAFELIEQAARGLLEALIARS